MLAPDSYTTGMDWLLDRTVESCWISVAFGQSSFTDLDFADDASLLAEVLYVTIRIFTQVNTSAQNVANVIGVIQT